MHVDKCLFAQNAEWLKRVVNYAGLMTSTEITSEVRESDSHDYKNWPPLSYFYFLSVSFCRSDGDTKPSNICDAVTYTILMF